MADGGGGIIDGIGEDLTGAVVPFSGSYSIGPDWRGSATITALEGSSTFRLVMSSTNEGRLIPFDVTAFPMEILFAPETIGTIEKQDPSAFLNSALNGGYAFMFSGFGENGALAASGRFTADGAGGISEGAEDHNDGGVVSVNIPFTGTYSVGASRRGTASFTSSLGTSNFAFYVISARKLRFISIDILTPFVFGTAERQESASFSNTSFSGNYVLFSNASGPSSTTFTLGRFTAGGDGSISSGLLDINNGGSAFENLPFTANYTIVANGRGTLTLTNELETSNFALAMISPQSAFFIQTDTTQTSGGRIDAQQGTSFTNGSLAGGWALELAGISIEVTTKIIAKLVGMVAQANANGAGNLTGKNDLYLNDPNGQGTLTLDGAFGGAYTVSSNGRVAASVNTGAGQIELRGYVAGSKIPLIGVDIFHFVMGAAHRQF